MEWRQVKGYEGLYDVSENGDIRSLFRYKKTLKHSVTRTGYHSVELHKDKSGKRMLVHRIVAMAFLDNPDNYNQVNHKDENKSNNCVNNLEWCDAKYNMNYGTGPQRRRNSTDYSKPIYKRIAVENGKKVSKPVSMIQKDGVCLAWWESGKRASIETGVNHSHIMECCAGKRKSAGGYVWKYKTEE